MPRLHLPLAALLLGAAACNPLEPRGPTERTLVVQHHREECVGEGYHLCLLIREPRQAEFLRHYGGIEGFEHQWGYVYEIEVEDHRVANPPADGSSIRTVLRRIVARERVPQGTEFETFLTAGHGRVVEVAPDRYRVYFSAAEFVCPPGTGCAELRTHVAAGARIRYRFRQPAAAADPLTVVEWQACRGGAPGSRICTP
jgi:hypothetical protein